MTNISPENYVQAMQRAFKPAEAAGLRATYTLQLTGPGGGTWTIDVANQQCQIRGGATAQGTTITMSTANYVKLAAGQLDVLAAYKRGEVAVNGNIQHALQFPDLFTPWAELAQAGAPVEPPAPAPVRPSTGRTAPKPTPAPVRPSPAPASPALVDYFRAMPASFRPDKAGGLKAVYQFNITGEGALAVAIDNGRVSVTEGAASSPTVVIGMSRDDFIKLSHDQLNTVQAYRSGQIQVSGEVNLAARFDEMFGPWGKTVDQQTAPTPAPAAPAPTPAPAAPSAPAAGDVYPQLLNGSFDEYQPYVRDGEAKVWKENQYPERYGKYWNLKLLSERKSRIHLMDSDVFGKFTQKYFGGGGRDYHIHGRHSQVITGRYGFDVTLFQTVAAQPGRDYTFGGSIVSFYKGTSGDRKDGVIFKTIGIDPTGGRDVKAASVVWGERDGKDNEWRYPSLKVKAQGNAITVFIRIENTADDVGSTELNTIHLDNFKLE